jgi:hypothetical protein
MKRIVFILIAFLTSFAIAQNTSTVTQDGSTNAADVMQKFISGDLNNSIILQDGGVQGSEVMVEQKGGGNISDVHQTLLWGAYGSDNDNKANIKQVGYNNNVTALQIYDNEELDVNQIGDNNMSFSEQIGNENKIFVDQFDVLNQSFVFQKHSNNRATVKQSVMQNVSTIDQNNSFQAVAMVAQKGIMNNSLVTQGDYRDYAEVMQIGDGNTSSVNQAGIIDLSWTTGKNNEADVYQNGTNNFSDIFQYGETNSASVDQRNIGNVSWINQNGTSNSVNVTQN